MRYWECEGLTSIEACQVLNTLARNVPAHQAIVEIGVFRGRSLLALAEGSMAGSNVEVRGIDPWNLVRPSKAKYKSDETFLYVRQAVHDSPAGHLIVLTKGYGVTEAARWQGPVGLLYIDADHRYQPVLDDVAAWAPHLVPGAIVCFDDYDRATFPGVVQAVDELVASGAIDNLFLATDRLAVARWAR